MSRHKNNRKKKGTEKISDILLWNISLKEGDGYLRTAANYRSCMNKAGAYLGKDFRHFTFPELTARWVKGYVNWLKRLHPGSPNTVEFYLRGLRAMCRNYREKHRLAWSEGSDPFSGVTLCTEPTTKRALTPGLLSGLFAPELRERLDESGRESLDVLHFILFMRGMVFQDIWNLRHDMIGRDGHIRYRRSKTGALIDVEVTPEAEAIIRRHARKDSPYVFPFLHEKKGGRSRKGQAPRKNGKAGELPEESALRRVNRHARAIGRMAGLPAPLTTYVLRHTWATLMLEAGYPVELIGQCLGHASVNTTRIYLAGISSGQVDTAVNDMFNRLVRPLAKNDDTLLKYPETEESGKHRPESVSSDVRQAGARELGIISRLSVRGKSGISGPGKRKGCPFLTERETSFMGSIPHTSLPVQI